MLARAIHEDSLVSLIVGPLVWSAHFLIVYLSTAITCAKGFFEVNVMGMGIAPLVVAAATLLALALIVDGALLAYRRCSEPGRNARPSPDNGSRRFMAHTALLLYGLSLLAIIWEALPVFLITSCR